MNHEEEMRLYHNAVKLWGGTFQVLMLGEEQAELFKAASKIIRSGAPTKEQRDELVEELADNEIMLKQMRIVFQIPAEEINRVKDAKLQRLKKIVERGSQ